MEILEKFFVIDAIFFPDRYPTTAIETNSQMVD